MLPAVDMNLDINVLEELHRIFDILLRESKRRSRRTAPTINPESIESICKELRKSSVKDIWVHKANRWLETVFSAIQCPGISTDVLKLYHSVNNAETETIFFEAQYLSYETSYCKAPQWHQSEYLRKIRKKLGCGSYVDTKETTANTQKKRTIADSASADPSMKRRRRSDTYTDVPENQEISVQIPDKHEELKDQEEIRRTAFEGPITPMSDDVSLPPCSPQIMDVDVVKLVDGTITAVPKGAEEDTNMETFSEPLSCVSISCDLPPASEIGIVTSEPSSMRINPRLIPRSPQILDGSYNILGTRIADVPKKLREQQQDIIVGKPCVSCIDTPYSPSAGEVGVMHLESSPMPIKPEFHSWAPHILDDITISVGSATTVPKEDEVDSLPSRSRPVPIDLENEPPFSDLSKSDPTTHKVELSETILLSAPPRPRPKLPHLPPIWAQSRQEVCESFEWFRSYQGGVYALGGIVKGYLLGGFSAQRDGFFHNGKLIISHGGGKAKCLHASNGAKQMRAATDQSSADLSVSALLANYKNKRPLALIIDQKYQRFPFDLAADNIAYAVLGFYTIVNAWSEYEDISDENDSFTRVVRYKFAFRWCEDQQFGMKEPWWSETSDFNLKMLELAPILRRQPRENRKPPAKYVPHEDVLDYPTEPGTKQCQYCAQWSPTVFELGWACLIPTCTQFWTLPDSNSLLSTGALKFSSQFLSLKRPDSSRAYSLWPAPPPVEAPEAGSTTQHLFSRGWHCRNCGRLSCRFHWTHWECSYCHKTVQTKHTIHRYNDFERPKGKERDYIIPNNESHKVENAGLRTFAMKAPAQGLGQVQTFVLPNDWGKIHLIQCARAGKKYAQTMFKSYQEQAASGALQFKRWPLRAHKLRGDLLTNYYSNNAGEPYQYVGGTTNTTPLDRASPAIREGLAFMQNQMEAALGMRSEHTKFNEVLSAAYMENQKMAYHSDAEKGLGPIVAGLSLGAPAQMHFRLHRQYETHHNRPIAMTFVLHHGDVLVMEGEKIQIVYEHRVEPSNFRISATARWIEPGMTPNN